MPDRKRRSPQRDGEGAPKNEGVGDHWNMLDIEVAVNMPLWGTLGGLARYAGTDNGTAKIFATRAVSDPLNALKAVLPVVEWVMCGWGPPHEEEDAESKACINQAVKLCSALVDIWTFIDRATRSE